MSHVCAASDYNQKVHSTAKAILKASQVFLTTHRHCDGDGLGAELALYHALSWLKKATQVWHLDLPAKKYDFLSWRSIIKIFDSAVELGELENLAGTLVLVFDTNDHRLIEPLYSKWLERGAQFIFIDHHPILEKGPAPSKASIVQLSAASTGEIAFDLIRALGCSIETETARCLYASIVFDTQLFRFIRKSGRSYQIASELLQVPFDIEEVHRNLFALYTKEKLQFLSEVLPTIDFHYQDQLAVLALSNESLVTRGLEVEDSRDLLDFIMGVKSLKVGALIREISPKESKLSLRSHGDIEVLSLAEDFGGGGHPYAAGALCKNLTLAQVKSKILEFFKARLT